MMNNEFSQEAERPEEGNDQFASQRHIPYSIPPPEIIDTPLKEDIDTTPLPEDVSYTVFLDEITDGLPISEEKISQPSESQPLSFDITIPALFHGLEPELLSFSETPTIPTIEDEQTIPYVFPVGEELPALLPADTLPDSLAAILPIPQVDEHELARNNDQFVSFVQKYGPSLYSWIYHITCDYDDTYDAVQDMFIEASRSWNLLQTYEEAHLRNWAYKVSYRKVIDMKRRIARRFASIKKYGEQNMHSVGDHQPAPFEHAHSETTYRVHQILKKLSRKERASLLLYEHHGYSIAEIAEMLGLKEKSVWDNIYRARTKFMASYILLLHEHDGYSIAEIAEMLGLKEERVWDNIHRARTKFGAAYLLLLFSDLEGGLE